MDQINTVITNILAGLQGLGVGATALSIGFAAFSFIKGGQEGIENGKKRLVWAAAGLGVLLAATVASSWLKSQMTF